MALNLRYYPDPVLKKRASEVEIFDQNISATLEAMSDTMYKNDGVGLAANQVGLLQRLTVIDISEDQSELLKLVNPQIIESSGKTSHKEGCLSIPGFRESVDRFERVVVAFQDPSGKALKLEATGLLAVCLQHEIDHLDGVLFVDRLSILKKEMFYKWLKKNQSA